MQVSIPHRYAKTLSAVLLEYYPFVVSIPHRYAKNRFSESLTSRTLVSIPHRYAKNSDQLYLILSAILVSIPHRYAKNLFQGLYFGYAFSGFNSS